MEVFGMQESGEESDEGVLPSDSDDKDLFHQGHGWEPACSTPPTRSPSPEGEVFDNDDNIPIHGNHSTESDRFLTRPTVVTFQDAFPQSLAGALPSQAAEIFHYPYPLLLQGLSFRTQLENQDMKATKVHLKTATQISGRPLHQSWSGSWYDGQSFEALAQWPYQISCRSKVCVFSSPRSASSTDRVFQFQEHLKLSFKNAAELNKIIDDKLPIRPRFQWNEIVVAGEAYDVYFRDIIACIKVLYGDPHFTQILVFTPEQHYVDRDAGVQLFHDMHTGKWWWEMQKTVEARSPGATIIPVILSSDKTVVTLFGNKTAYPIYLTIGTLPKEIRRKPSQHGHILIGYLPTTRLEQITNQASRRHISTNLFHACLTKIVEPLKEAGISGIYMASSDGIVRRCHPMLADYIGDYPEQLLVTLIKNDLEEILDALASITEGSTIFARNCRDAGIKPVQGPFWEGLPYANVYRAITPDILHELYQGVMKHLIAWIIEAYGAAEIDARCRCLPPNHNIRVFVKGISSLSRVTGCEHDQMCRFILGIIVDIPLPNNLPSEQLVCAVRALLDFLYISQYPIHSSETLALLDAALQDFHCNKDIFIDLGIRSHFNFLKLHKMKHYRSAIEALGTTDNYNTEYTERLYIDMAKDAYRSTNHKDEFTQMTKWLKRKEKIFFHDNFIQWHLSGEPPPADNSWHSPGFSHQPHLQMTAHPSIRRVPLTTVTSKYGATHFIPALARYAARMSDPSLCTAAELERRAQDIDLPFNSISVYHNIKFWNCDAHGREQTSDILDVVHVKPSTIVGRGKFVPGCFDTVLVKDGGGGHFNKVLAGYRVAQVHVVFTLTDRVISSLFSGTFQPPKHLAYVEWFTPFKNAPEPNHRMYKISRSMLSGQRVASIISVCDIRRSVHLIPKCGPVIPPEWTSATSLELGSSFFVNPFLDRHSYLTVI
ncbi:hypothetical protein DXG03_002334 [Asterophora parasitica]|uniref:DUF6830 domain-containing protein n=1 Tax=Asterophora parasitica TaxID=117018 RepID=A0A9P7KCA5_9AGAR|nr:hypothetical protein DXG03_002334 [Asterophora parasitica]